MTDQIFFDTDCLSAFLWTNQGSIVTRLYTGRIIIPQMVYDELFRVKNLSFCERLNLLIAEGKVELWDIELSSKEFPLYREMTNSPLQGYKAVGKGEASAMALASFHNGTVASNNFRDTKAYIKRLNLNYTTTGDILIEAYDSGLICEDEGNDIWKEMLSEGRWLGAKSFTEHLNSPHKPLLQR